MSVLYRLSFKTSGQSGSFDAPGEFDYYVLPDGRTVHVNLCMVWCRGCSGIAWAESLRPLEDVEQEIKTWEDPESAPLQHELTSYQHDDQKQWCINHNLRMHRAYRDLLLVRSAPSRCRKCGGTDYVVIPFEKEFLLPDQSDSITLSWAGFATVLGGKRYFDPDGHPMPDDYLPPDPVGDHWEPFPEHLEREGAWKDWVCILTFPLWALPALIVVGGVILWQMWQQFKDRRKYSSDDYSSFAAHGLHPLIGDGRDVPETSQKRPGN